MAVEFISNGYDTTSTNPYTEGAWADAHPSIGLATYGVRSPGDWKVTAVAGQDRTVSIAAGRGFGCGVTDLTYTNDTLQLDTIASGSRWDLIAVRRDWTPTAGVSKFVKVNGGATAVIPGGRNSNPGGIDDQPIALVQVTAGQTQPTSIIDLRTWSGDGGGIVAAHDLVRSFLNKTGTRLNINGVDWLRRSGANDTPEWVKITDGNPKGAAYTPSWTGAETWGGGAIVKGYYWRDGTHVRVQAMIQAGSSSSLGLGVIGFSLPPGLPLGADFMATGAGVWNSSGTSGAIRPVITAAGPGQTSASVWATPGTNQVVTPGSAGWPWGTGCAFHVWLEYKTDAA